MYFDVFSDLFPKSFQDHVSRLQADTQYRSEFQAAVATMPLRVWYETPKWKCTARFLKLLNPACERCEAPRPLQVHHKNYKHLGIEILFPGDLQVLCDICHRTTHQMTLWPAVPKFRPELIAPMQHFPMR